MVSFAVMLSPSTLYGALSEKRKPITSYTEPRKNENVPRRNELPRSEPSERHGSVNERNAALPVCNQEAKRNPAMTARIDRNGDTVLTVKKRNFPFLTHQNVSHTIKALSIGKSAFSYALERAFLSEKRLTSKTL